MKTSQTNLINEMVVEYHKLYALYKKPEYLEIAGMIGKVKLEDPDEMWERKVNEGCKREGIPPLYPERVDKSEHENYSG